MKHRSRLARLAGAAGLLLASTTVVVATGAAPAHATVVDNPTFAPVGTINASAVATCPVGEYLTGGGGAILNGGGDVTLTDIIPDLATRSVTVWGHVNPGAVAGAYTVVAQAICLPGPPPPGYTLVASSTPNNGNPIKSAVVACPAGTDLLGLGAELQGANGEVFYQQIEPNAALDAGMVTAGAAGGFAGPWQLFMYGICANLPAGLTGTLVSATGAFNGVNPKSQGAGVCPMAAVATGVGGTVAPSATGNVLLTQVRANPAQNAGLASAVEDGSYLPSWNLAGHLICWGP